MKKVQQGFTLIELMIVVAIIGILAAIALPAYQDYVGRSQMSEAMTLASGQKTAVSEVWQSTGSWPSSNASAGISAAADIEGTYVAQVTVSGSGVITATMRNAAPVVTDIRADTLTLTPTDNTGSVSWVCASSAASKYLPSGCR